MSSKGNTKVYLDPASSFKSMDEAADAVSKAFPSASNEKSAVIIKKPDGTYGYSTVAEGQDEHFALSAMLPKGYTLAGIVHSHPGNDSQAGYFSPDDMNTAQGLNVPSYVRFDSDSSIRKYIPGQSKTTSIPALDNPRALQKVAYGDPVTLSPPPAPPEVALGSGTPVMASPAASTLGSAPMTASDSGVTRRDDSLTQH